MNVILSLLIAFSGIWTPTPGNAYVQSALGNTTWNNSLTSAVRTVDSYTASHDVYAHCRSGARCITVKWGTVSGSSLGHTQCVNGNCTIVVERGTPRAYITYLLIHELGHAFGLGHRTRCDSIMYPIRTCWPTLHGNYFQPIEKRALRRA